MVLGERDRGMSFARRRYRVFSSFSRRLRLMEAPVRIPILAVAALALAGCNANHGVNPSSQTAPGAAPGVVAGPSFPNFNPWNPISYAQTSGVYIGRGKSRH